MTGLAGQGCVGLAAPRTKARQPGLIERLRESEKTGVLQDDFPVDSSTREVNELVRAFNLAARSLAESQRQLDEA